MKNVKNDVECTAGEGENDANTPMHPHRLIEKPNYTSSTQSKLKSLGEKRCKNSEKKIQTRHELNHLRRKHMHQSEIKRENEKKGRNREEEKEKERGGKKRKRVLVHQEKEIIKISRIDDDGLDAFEGP